MKKIAKIVIGFHIVILATLMWAKEKKKTFTPMKVRTVLAPKKAVKPVASVSKAVPTPAKTPPAKKPAPPKPKPVKAAPVQVKKEPVVSSSLKAELKESIAKISTKSDNKRQTTLPTPSKIEILAGKGGRSYEGKLVSFLQNRLSLPEKGEVGLMLTIDATGVLDRLEVIKEGSHVNEAYLKRELKNMKFPSFTDDLKNEKMETFQLTFCST